MSTPRGFAAMTPERRRELARLGGKAVSEDREHMSKIGRKGSNGQGSKGPK